LLWLALGRLHRRRRSTRRRLALRLRLARSLRLRLLRLRLRLRLLSLRLCLALRLRLLLRLRLCLGLRLRLVLRRGGRARLLRLRSRRGLRRAVPRGGGGPRPGGRPLDRLPRPEGRPRDSGLALDRLLEPLRRRRPVQTGDPTGLLDTVKQLPKTPRQTMLGGSRELLERDPLERDGHHHPREARARLAQLERLHRRTAGTGQLRRELRQTRGDARSRRVAPELDAKLGVDQQPLDQPPGALGIDVIGRHG
jgi:hypothetical protein